jgi:peptidoglycan hydrolase CwlO-like protein
MSVLEQIERISKKAKERVQEINNLQNQVARQKEIISELKQKNETLEEQVNLLKEQKQILQASIGKMNPEEKTAFETTINKYIREIDKCIALLSE